MKFWQKIYLVTLIIILIFLNGGIYLVFQITYQKNIETEQKRAESDYTITKNAIQKDMQALEQRGELNDTVIVSLFETYEQFYSKYNLSFQLWKGEQQIYSNVADSDVKKETPKTGNKVEIHTINHMKYIYVTEEISGLVYQYNLVYVRPLTELNEIWSQLNLIFVIASVSISVLLAIVLFLLFQHFTVPIGKLSDAANRFAEGNYKERVHIPGKDEIAELAGNFNNMASEIELKISEITLETEKKQIFIDNLAHELKTPLTSIYGYAEYMQKAKISEEDRNVSLEYMMHESKRLKNLAYALLDLALIRNDKIEFEELDTSSLLNSALRTVELKMEEKKIQVVKELSTSHIKGNKNLLESLLVNLLMNAACACEIGGEINIQISGNQDYDNRMIEITDNGIGMNEDELKRIMEPFYRVDKARSRENGGAGLGLALCKQIVEVHKGHINYYSQPKEGTSVVVEIWV